MCGAGGVPALTGRSRWHCPMQGARHCPAQGSGTAPRTALALHHAGLWHCPMQGAWHWVSWLPSIVFRQRFGQEFLLLEAGAPCWAFLEGRFLPLGLSEPLPLLPQQCLPWHPQLSCGAGSGAREAPLELGAWLCPASGRRGAVSGHLPFSTVYVQFPRQQSRDTLPKGLWCHEGGEQPCWVPQRPGQQR